MRHLKDYYQSDEIRTRPSRHLYKKKNNQKNALLPFPLMIHSCLPNPVLEEQDGRDTETTPCPPILHHYHPRGF
jgi:hypothetical protein